MKKFAVLSMAVVMVCCLVGCNCNHQWSEASCTEPRTCVLCDLAEEAALGHEWAEVSCETPKTCTRCALTEGEALGHQWSRANCVSGQTCSNCQTIVGDIGHHIDVEAIGSSKGGELWYICACGEELTVPVQELTMQMLQGKWTLRAVMRNGEFYRPDPEGNWNEGAWLEFPAAEEPMGFEMGESELATAAIPQVLVNFDKTTAMLYANGPEIPVLTCDARSDYGDNQYLSTPIILTVGDWNRRPEEMSDEDFLKNAMNGTVPAIWRFHTDGTYIYQYHI